MARYLGSKHRLCRRVGEKLCTSDKCPVTRRNYPPGAHGPSQGKVKLTSFGLQLREKQKAKRVYGILERQFRRYVDKALRQKGNTGEILTQMLETRLDNVAFRLGFGKTRDQARQLVSHGHFTVNGKSVNIPSYELKSGDVVAVASKSVKSKYFENIAANLSQYETKGWLTLDAAALSGKMLNLPGGEDLKQNFDAKVITEFYSR